MTARIHVPYGQIADFRKRRHVKRMALFGPVIRDDVTDASDVDVLVEFEPGRTPGLAFFAMELELSDLLGQKGRPEYGGLARSVFPAGCSGRGRGDLCLGMTRWS